MKAFSRTILLSLAAFLCQGASAQMDSRFQTVGAARPIADESGYARPSEPRTDSPRADVSLSPSPLPAVIGKDYKVGPNDLLEIEVLDLENMKRTVRVNAAGAISLPLIGSVPIAGLTSQEVEARVADRYREKYLQNPQVSVFIKEFTTERITVEGAVARPGIFPLAGQMTLLRALALAGGFGPIANSHEVMLFRRNDSHAQDVKVFDIDQIRAGKSEDPPIRGDDLIVVQQDQSRKVFKDSLFRDIVDSLNPFAIFARP